MRSWLKPLLIWLLVLALPVQATAAASMVLCGTAHLAGASARVAQSQSHADAGHVHPGENLHPGHNLAHGTVHTVQAQHLAQVSDEPAADVSAVAQADAGQLTHGDTHKCSACASCCAGGAMISATPQLLLPDSCATEFLAVVQAIEAVAAAGPDRPPRNILA